MKKKSIQELLKTEMLSIETVRRVLFYSCDDRYIVMKNLKDDVFEDEWTEAFDNRFYMGHNFEDALYCLQQDIEDR